MDVIDAMCGKWIMDPSGTENVEAFCKATEMPEAMKEKQMNAKKVVSEVSRKGDTITTVTSKDSEVDTQEFQLGVPFKSVANGAETETTFKVEGNMLIGEYNTFGRKTTTRRYLKDGKTIVELEFNGTAMKYVLQKS